VSVVTITLTRIDPTGTDREPLTNFVSGAEWPFHVNHRPTRDQVLAGIGAGAYRDEDNDSFWVDHAGSGRIGLLRLEDLSDDAPLFDLRLGVSWRGRGLGVPVLQAVTRHVFTTMPQVNRFEGQTREDNVAMRKTFLRCGWVKEAHYREGWPVPDGRPLASVAYAVLRRDWETGTTTTFVWEDLEV
jgi:RimJ/RimL family protein N-acetyltransferase